MFGFNFIYEKVSNLLSRPAEKNKVIETPLELTVGCVESVTAGALCNMLCSKVGSSKTFMGGIIAYSIPSKSTMLGIDVEYSESHNFANNFTISEMVKAGAAKIPARVILATAGFSLPYQGKNFAIDKPYAIISLYDSQTAYEIAHRIDLPYVPEECHERQRAENQVRVACAAVELYNNYCVTIGRQPLDGSQH